MSTSVARGALHKVVPLGTRGRERSPGVRLFSDCRELLLERLTQWLNDTAPAVSEELFALADTTRERQQQTRYLDLRAAVERDWSALVAAFRGEFASAVERGLSPPATPAGALDLASKASGSSDLQLVDDADLSEHIVVREFSALLSESCADELYCLERRVAALLGQDETDRLANPLAPTVLCQALSTACNTLVTDSEARLLLLRRLQRHLQRALPAIYQQLNLLLIERGILPELKRSYRRTTGSEGEPPRAAYPSEALQATFATPRSSPTDTDGGPDTLSGEAILAALHRLAQARAFQGSAAGAGATSSATPWSPDAPTHNTMLLASLDALQHAPATAPGEAIINQARQLRDSDAAQSAGALEAVTIDIIAMLFDFIFDDAHIPVAVKALVSRLQIPVLKVAMLDPGFFADRRHPTRRFLGSISGVSIRWGDSVDEDDPFFRKLAELIERIQNEFESDVGIFGTALAEIEDFVARHQGEDENTALSVAPRLSERERQNEARERAQHAVRAFCQQSSPPALIEAFLAEQWVGVLQAAALDDETESTAWQDAEKLMTDLAWSVTAKKSAEDRFKLITLLPALLASLKHGLASVGRAAGQNDAFFDALLRHHAAALKGEQVTPAAGKDDSVTTENSQARPAADNRDGGLRVDRSMDQGIEVEEIDLVDASPVWHADDREIYRQVGELQRGDWVEFAAFDAVDALDRSVEPDQTGAGNEMHGPAATHRERLNWISPQRGILLFSNHRSARAISISPDALVRRIRDGKARIVHPDALFERALSGALQSANALAN